MHSCVKSLTLLQLFQIFKFFYLIEGKIVIESSQCAAKCWFFLEKVSNHLNVINTKSRLVCSNLLALGVCQSNLRRLGGDAVGALQSLISHRRRKNFHPLHKCSFGDDNLQDEWAISWNFMNNLRGLKRRSNLINRHQRNHRGWRDCDWPTQKVGPEWIDVVTVSQWLVV